MIDILVCDDSAEIVEQVKKLLCAWEKVNTVSFNIDCRQSGKFILENKHKYDIAFIDIEMPEMSGLELAVELKKQNPDVLIIVLTSFQRYLDDAMRIHVFRYLSKPVDVNRFNKNLFDAVQEYRTLSKTIILETHDIVKKIKTKDILYIENRRYGALLVTKDAEYVTEDRKGNGLILSNPIKINTTLANLDAISRHTVIDKDKEYNVAVDYKNKLNTKCPTVEQNVGNLSGGNQQKVLLAKWMFTDPDILILDEPTRGIDVGAKYEIYCIINQLVAEGKSVIMISSELPEILGMCDRIYVMNEGKIVGELAGSEATQELIMSKILSAGKKGALA